MSFERIIFLLFNSFRTSSKILESCGAPLWIKIETGHIVFLFKTKVTLKPIYVSLVVE